MIARIRAANPIARVAAGVALAGAWVAAAVALDVPELATDLVRAAAAAIV